MRNNFDDILKKKWEEFHFPVDEDHRNEMIAMLDQHKRRRTGIFWWLSGLGGVILLASFILFMIEPETNTPAHPSPQQLTEDNIDAHAQSNLNSYEQNSEASTEKNNVASTKILTVPETPTVDHSAGNSKQPSSQLITKNGSEINSISNPINNTNTGKTTDTHNTKFDQGVTGPEVIEKIQVRDSKTVSKTFEAIEETQMQDGSTGAVSSEADELSTKQQAQIVETRATDLILNPIDVLDILELTYSRDIKQVNAVIIKRHPIYLFAEAGGGFVPGVASKFNSGWATQAGAGFAYGLNEKQHLTLSAGYQLQHSGFDFERSSAVFQPAFGERSNFHSLSPDRLHFVYARLGIHHRMHRHILSLYGGTQFIYGAQGTIVIRTEDQLTGNAENSDYAWLSTDGMNRWLWNAEFQYGYQLTPLVSLHGGIKYNFSSLKAIDPALEDEGYTWEGKYTAFSPNLTIKYFLYGKK